MGKAMGAPGHPHRFPFRHHKRLEVPRYLLWCLGNLTVSDAFQIEAPMKADVRYRTASTARGDERGGSSQASMMSGELVSTFESDPNHAVQIGSA